MHKIYIVLIEDTSKNSSTLEPMLSKNCPDVIISGTAKNITEADEIIAKDEFDAIFLDLDIGSEEAFRFLEKSLPILDEKELVIISSGTEHAIEAFQYMAIDFILKPVLPEAIMQAVERVRKNVDLRIVQTQNREMLDKGPVKIIAIPSLTDIKIVPVDDIIYLESEGRYTLFHTVKNEKLVSSRNLGMYEKILVNNSFLRIHHSYLVNMNFALNIQKKDGFYMEVPNKRFLSISKRKMDALYEFLSIK